MGTSNPAESHAIPSFRRMPFIAAEEPRDVPDLPIQDEAAPRPEKAMAPEVGSADFIGPSPPPQKAKPKFGRNWHWGLIGFGVMAAAGFGGLKLYQSTQIPALAAVATSPRPALNSSTALSASRDAATRSPQAPAAAPAPAKVEATATTTAPAPAQAEGPPAGPQPVAQGEAASNPAPGSAPPPSAPSRPSAAEIMAASRKVVALPMTGDDQRQVLDLMAATNSIVLQLKRQVDDGGKKMGEMQAQLDDMKRMVSLNQVRLLSGATQIAMGNMPPAPQPPPAAAASPAAGAQPGAETPDMGPACRLRPSYIVASASPAHATLKNGGQVFISVRAPSRDNAQGDSIPCYGHVLKITQEGSRWVVMTERDVIGRN